MASIISAALPLGTFLLILLSAGADGVTVHFTTSGGHKSGDHTELAGVYRATIDVATLIANDAAYSKKSISKPDFTCWAKEDGQTSLSGLAVNSLSYDDVSKQTTLQIDLMKRKVATVFHGKTCDPQTNCGKDRKKLQSVMVNLKTKDGGYIKPVTSYNGTWYFMYRPHAERQSVRFGYMPYMELRKIKADQELPLDSKDLVDVNRFSTVVANVTTKDESWLKPADSLLVLPRSNGGLSLVVATRAAIFTDPPIDTTLKEFSYKLFAIIITSSGVGVARPIQTITANKRWFDHVVHGEGGISYRNGTLCWSAVEEIVCGKWTPDQAVAPLKSPDQMLGPGDATSVCPGPWRTDYYDKVITGVAIAEVPAMPNSAGRTSLFFGCFASVESRGGLGLHVTTAAGERRVIAVKDAGGALLAGSVFTVADDNCPPTAGDGGGAAVPGWSGHLVLATLAVVCFLRA